MRWSCLLFLLLLGAAQPLRDNNGTVLGYTNSTLQVGKTFVTDCYGRTLGYTTASGTFDNNGKKLVEYPDVGLLQRRSSCPAANRVYNR